MELEMGSLIVLACKRIKDLQYLVESQNERLLSSENEYQLILSQYQEKAIQLDQMQQNLLQLVGMPKQQPSHPSFFGTQKSPRVANQISPEKKDSPSGIRSVMTQ